MNVTLPDGTVLQGVPEGTTKAQLRAKLASNGYDVSKLPEDEPTWGDRGREFLQGGKGRIGEMGLGIKGLAVPISQAEKDAVKIPDTWAGTAGSIAADVGTMLIPGGAFVKATQGLKMLPRVAANMGFNAGTAAALVPENRGVAAAFGAAGGAVGDAVGGVVRKLAPLATASGRQGLRQARAGKVLASDLGADALTVAKQLEGYRPQVLGQDVPVTTAQAMRQIEGNAPGPASVALTKRQLGVSGVAADDFAELARRQNEALYDVATNRAGRDAGRLDQLTQSRAAATDPMRENALRLANVEGAALGAPLATNVAELVARSVPGSPQRGLANLMQQMLAGNPDARQLYEMRKLLANKLSGPHMPGDDVAAVVKGAERETRQLMSAIDARLQQASSREYTPVQADMLAEGVERWKGSPGVAPRDELRLTPYAENQQDLFAPPAQMELLNMPTGVQVIPGTPGRLPTDPGEAIPHGPNQIPLIPPEVQQAQPGQWNPYLERYREMSVPVTSARTQGQITEALTPEGGALVGNAPEVTRHKLAQAVKKFGSDKRGFERLDPAAKARYEELQQFMQRNEESMRSTKLGGTGGGGSQTSMQNQMGSDLAPAVVNIALGAAGLPHAGTGFAIGRAGAHALNAGTKRELAQLMLDPQRAAAGIQAALAQNKPLSEAQVAFRAFMRTQGTAAGAGAARE
jgi:hypothetical protein